MDRTEPAKITIRVPHSVRDHLGRIAAQRSRAGTPTSTAALVREAVSAHFDIDVPAMSAHRRPTRHQP